MGKWMVGAALLLASCLPFALPCHGSRGGDSREPQTVEVRPAEAARAAEPGAPADQSWYGPYRHEAALAVAKRLARQGYRTNVLRGGDGHSWVWAW
jgi:hypothetical protein